MSTQYLCLDTNIPLLDANNIVSLGSQPDTIIVLPETVLDELDSKKSGLGELAYQARSFGRMISRCGQPERTLHDNMIISKFKYNGVAIWIVSLTKYPSFEDVAKNVLNDRKIIEVALQFAQFYQPVTFISNDVMCRIRADSLGLDVTDFKIVDKVDYEFTKHLEVSEGTFRTLHNRSILEVDPEYLVEHYNYKFSTPDSAQIKLASIHNGTVNILGKDTEQELRRQMVSPSNSGQLMLSRAVCDPAIDLVLLEGPAGTGKNICTLSSAIKLYKANKGKYTSIVYIRTPQNDEAPGEDIGYLSGNEEKLELYLGPLQDTVDFLIRSNTTTKGLKQEDVELKVAERTEKLIADYNIEARISTGVRGRTFHSTILILDEMQNASPTTMQKLLTRVGKDCKVIVMGSNRQIDNKYLTKFNNGLTVLLNESRLRTIDSNINIFATELTSVLRSDMAMFAEDLFSSTSS